MRFTRAVFLNALAVLCAVSISRGQELPTAQPEQVGMSSEKLARVSQALRGLVDEHKVAGAITMVARRGKVVQFEAIGKRDIDADLPMELDTICRVFSMTKPVTSVAVMILVEEGKVGLDDCVSKYLPEFEGVRVFLRESEMKIETQEASREPTVRDLLRHTGGLTYGLFGLTPVDQMYNRAQVLNPQVSLSEMTKKLGDIPLLYQPGSKWNYSIGVDVLGRLVEVVSGMALDEFFDRRIFQPLDMRDSGFYVPAEKLERFSANYGSRAEGGLRSIETPATSPFRTKPALLSGGGGLVSTARDYMRFCQMLVNRGELNGHRMLRAETVQEMTRDQLPPSTFPISFGPIQRRGVGFGLGFGIQVSQGDAFSAARIGEYGWGGAASTHFWISPKDELVVVALQQFMPFSLRLEQTVKPLVYESIAD